MIRSGKSRLSVLRGDMRTYFIAHSLNSLGDSAAPVGMAFGVLGIGGTAGQLGVLLATRSVAITLMLVLGGAYADRIDRRLVLVVADVLRCISQAGFAVLLVAGMDYFVPMLLLQCVNGFATGFARPASVGVVQALLSDNNRQAGNALLSLSRNIATIAGPAIAATAIAVGGGPAALALDSASFAASAMLLLRIRVPQGAAVAHRSVFGDIVDGLRVVVKTNWLALQILVFSLFQAIAIPAFTVIGPFMAQKHYGGAAAWALVTSLVGIGAVCGDICAARLRPVRPLVIVNGVALGMALLLLSLAARAPLWVICGAALIYGVGMSLPETVWGTVIQNRCSPSLISRVTSIGLLGAMVMRPAGQGAVAPVSELVGTETILFCATAAVLAGFGLMLLLPATWRLGSEWTADGMRIGDRE